MLFRSKTVQDNKQKRQMEFLATHTLTSDQLKKLIEEKFVRAEEYHQALKKREILCSEDR